MSEKNKSSERDDLSLDQEKKEVNRLDRYRIESFSSSSPELSEDVIKEIADFFRYMFNNAFPEYVICQDCNIQLSAPEVFETNDQFLSLNDLDNNVNLPCCPDCNQGMELFHDPEKVIMKITENLKKKAYVTLLRDNKNEGKLSGITFAYFDTFKNSFQKEWENEYIYMQDQDRRFDRNINSFLDKINKVFNEKKWEEINPESEVFCWNCTAVDKDAQGLTNILNMLRSFFTLVSTDSGHQDTQSLVFETRTDSTAHKLLKMSGAFDVPAIFPAEQIFMSGNLKDITKTFQLSKGDFIGLRKKRDTEVIRKRVEGLL